jgi:uncharacterized protein with PQ loop repeat
MIFQFLVRLRTYYVSFVSFVVENVACLLFMLVGVFISGLKIKKKVAS